MSDLQIPAGVTLVTDPTEQLLRVQPPRVEEEPAAAEAEEVAEEAAPEAEQAGEATSAAAGDFGGKLRVLARSEQGSFACHVVRASMSFAWHDDLRVSLCRSRVTLTFARHWECHELR